MSDSNTLKHADNRHRHMFLLVHHIPIVMHVRAPEPDDMH